MGVTDESVAAGPRGTDARAIGLLGGTFDPIHVGHLAMAREARRALDLERVLFVPNGDPPHKGPSVTAAVHRVAMVRLAIEEEPGFELSHLELERPGPSYAVDTVAHVAEQSHAEGRPEPWFILSDETLRDLPTWRQPERILELVRVAVAPRPGTARPDRAWLTQRFGPLETRVSFLAGPHLDIAATTIRERVRLGRDIAGLVPDAVAAYILEHELYGASAPTARGTMASSRPGTP
jgi:nicotinate-nucleotide adenylyltransferase